MSYEGVQKQKSPGCLVVGLIALGLSIPVIGILAALSIPAFLRFMERSIAAEAPVIVASIQSEVEAHFAQECSFPPSLPRVGDVEICCGNSSSLCSYDADRVAQWTQAGISLYQNDGYFLPETEYRADGTYAIRAVRDFRCGAPDHTYEVILHPNYDTCTVTADPGVIHNELQ